MSYSVGRHLKETTLIIHSDPGLTSTLCMNEKATVQLIKLLAATLENYRCEVWQDISIGEKDSNG